MERNSWKKAIAGVMSIAMVFGSTPDAAFAAVTNDNGYETGDISRTSEPDYDGFIQALLDSWDKCEDSVDVSAYNIPSRDASEFFQYAVSKSPRYFYVEPYKTTSDSSGMTVSVKNTYTYKGAALRNMLARYDAEVTNALAGMDKDLSDAEKVLYIHDYIALNTEYNQDSKETSIYKTDGMNSNAYGALVEKKATCLGYSNAFE